MSKWQVLVFLVLLMTGLAVADSVPHTLTYANGQLLKRGETLYYHDGNPLLDASGVVHYPSWQGGRMLRSLSGWPFSSATVWQPSGAAWMQKPNVLWYPTSDQSAHMLSDGINFFYRSGRKLTDRITREVFHESSAMAWNGRDRIWNAGGQEIDDGHVLLSSRLEPLDGALSINLHKTNGNVSFRFVLWLDLIHAGYVSPFVYQGENEIPEKLFSDLVFHVQTGFPGELLTVRVDEHAKVRYAFQTALSESNVPATWPMYPYMGVKHPGFAAVGITSDVNTLPCGVQILLQNPSQNTTLPAGFITKTHRRH